MVMQGVNKGENERIVKGDGKRIWVGLDVFREWREVV
jgi:hypothetical protein